MQVPAESLAKKTCVPCRAGTTPLKGAELEQWIEKLQSGWKVIEEHHLEKEYTFPNFKKGLEFVNKIGEVAEKENHHPDIFLAWGKVKVILWTHKISGLSENDFILAAKCDQLFAHSPLSQ